LPDGDVEGARARLLEQAGVPRTSITRLSPLSVTLVGFAEALRAFAGGPKLRLASLGEI
jgi:hypothetical protein